MSNLTKTKIAYADLTEAQREARREYQRQYRAAHKDKVRAWNRAFYLRTAAKIAAEGSKGGDE